MILKIQTGSNNPILHQSSDDVKTITPAVKQLALDMQETLTAVQGIGLAGPQVGQNLRIIVVDLSSYCDEEKNKKAYKMILINPKITKKSWRQTKTEEGCLSLPGEYLDIKRPRAVTVKALSLDSQKITVKATDLMAKVIQHEIDHLNGVLITDKVK